MVSGLGFAIQTYHGSNPSVTPLYATTPMQSESWYNCQCKQYDDTLHFKLRITGFRETSIQEIKSDSDDDEETEGVLWLLEIDVINLNKHPLEAYKVRNALELQDHEGYVFEALTAGKLDLDKKSGLHRFSGWSSNPALSPKIKAWGSILFSLPEEDAQYSVVIKDGSITFA